MSEFTEHFLCLPEKFDCGSVAVMCIVVTYSKNSSAVKKGKAKKVQVIE